ncbi:hypothetical protein HOLleu_01468 [Holothuria leucospilota]|uniref:Pol-like protein n=1 Tax=Holothuria leucospilota TaxID=206669 RepID=A0A9Q1CR17_HOLLE|nr:hypothetical protein HOLleu_01468 [Holothuria leucospilota]
MFSICNLNVNGLRDPAKRSRVIQFLKIHAFEITCLQETHFTDEGDVSSFQKEWGGLFFASCSNSPRSCGTGICFSPSFMESVSQVRADQRGRIFSVLVSPPMSPVFRMEHVGKGLKSRLDRIYAPSGFVVAKVSALNFPLSDHKPVVVSFTAMGGASVGGRGVWKCNVSVLHDQMFVNDFTHYFHLWQTLKPGFDSIIDWWENVKDRAKRLIIRHSVRLAQARRARLQVLQRACDRATEKELDGLLGGGCSVQGALPGRL